MEHVNGWYFRGIYKGGLWENDLHVSAHLSSSTVLRPREHFDRVCASCCEIRNQ